MDKYEALRNCRLFLLDMDGTLYLTDTPCRGAVDFIKTLKATGRRYIYLTNNSSHNHADCVEKLRGLGFPCEDGDVFTAGMAAGLYLKEHFPGKKICLVGTEALVGELAEYGVEVDNDKPEVVVAGFDSELTYDKLCKAIHHLRAGLPFIATNPDLVCPVKGGFIPDCGSICALLSAASGREPTYVGKPCREIIDVIRGMTGVPAEEICCVGDRLYTDIAVGLNGGTCTAAVLTGEVTREMLQTSDIRPHYVFEDVGELCEKLLQ